VLIRRSRVDYRLTIVPVNLDVFLRRRYNLRTKVLIIYMYSFISKIRNLIEP